MQSRFKIYRDLSISKYKIYSINQVGYLKTRLKNPELRKVWIPKNFKSLFTLDTFRGGPLDLCSGSRLPYLWSHVKSRVREMRREGLVRKIKNRNPSTIQLL